MSKSLKRRFFGSAALVSSVLYIAANGTSGTVLAAKNDVENTDEIIFKRANDSLSKGYFLTKGENVRKVNEEIFGKELIEKIYNIYSSQNSSNQVKDDALVKQVNGVYENYKKNWAILALGISNILEDDFVNGKYARNILESVGIVDYSKGLSVVIDNAYSKGELSLKFLKKLVESKEYKFDVYKFVNHFGKSREFFAKVFKNGNDSYDLKKFVGFLVGFGSKSTAGKGSGRANKKENKIDGKEVIKNILKVVFGVGDTETEKELDGIVDTAAANVKKKIFDGNGGNTGEKKVEWPDFVYALAKKEKVSCFCDDSSKDRVFEGRSKVKEINETKYAEETKKLEEIKKIFTGNVKINNSIASLWKDQAYLKVLKNELCNSQRNNASKYFKKANEILKRNVFCTSKINGKSAFDLNREIFGDKIVNKVVNFESEKSVVSSLRTSIEAVEKFYRTNWIQIAKFLFEGSDQKKKEVGAKLTVKGNAEKKDEQNLLSNLKRIGVKCNIAEDISAFFADKSEEGKFRWEFLNQLLPLPSKGKVVKVEDVSSDLFRFVFSNDNEYFFATTLNKKDVGYSKENIKNYQEFLLRYTTSKEMGTSKKDLKASVIRKKKLTENSDKIFKSLLCNNEDKIGLENFQKSAAEKCLDQLKKENEKKSVASDTKVKTDDFKEILGSRWFDTVLSLNIEHGITCLSINISKISSKEFEECDAAREWIEEAQNGIITMPSDEVIEYFKNYGKVKEEVANKILDGVEIRSSDKFLLDKNSLEKKNDLSCEGSKILNSGDVSLLTYKNFENYDKDNEKRVQEDSVDVDKFFDDIYGAKEFLPKRTMLRNCESDIESDKIGETDCHEENLVYKDDNESVIEYERHENKNEDSGKVLDIKNEIAVQDVKKSEENIDNDKKEEDGKEEYLRCFVSGRVIESSSNEQKNSFEEDFAEKQIIDVVSNTKNVSAGNSFFNLKTALGTLLSLPIFEEIGRYVYENRDKIFKTLTTIITSNGEEVQNINSLPLNLNSGINPSHGWGGALKKALLGGGAASVISSAAYKCATEYSANMSLTDNFPKSFGTFERFTYESLYDTVLSGTLDNNDSPAESEEFLPVK